MAVKYFISRSLISNKRGSTLIAMIALGGLFTITAISVIAGYQSRQRQQVHMYAMQDATHLQSNLWMIFASEAACKNNVISGQIPANITDLTNSESQKTLSLSYSVVGSNTPAIITPNMFVGHTIIKSIYFASMTSVDPAASYLGSLHISLTDSLGVPLNEIVMPFYFLTNVSGGITGCFASSFPEGSNSPVTMQDLLCQQYSGASSFYYSPQQHTCVDNGLVIGSR